MWIKCPSSSKLLHNTPHPPSTPPPPRSSPFMQFLSNILQGLPTHNGIWIARIRNFLPDRDFACAGIFYWRIRLLFQTKHINEVFYYFQIKTGLTLSGKYFFISVVFYIKNVYFYIIIRLMFGFRPFWTVRIRIRPKKYWKSVARVFLYNFFAFFYTYLLTYVLCCRLRGPVLARVPERGAGAGAAQQEELRQLNSLSRPSRD